ncbi:hypothetical protein EVG20_g1926 [Dentipellis fragilis]|uniref:Uncharacterized protein n=1 Tax=Dentipellis fragilis TaxID=205917 RepID=A0A4Y9ZAP6_9AGAM|nr:hypothetical protein EVG20_g1926 [Dentipellis fragilis]
MDNVMLANPLATEQTAENTRQMPPATQRGCATSQAMSPLTFLFLCVFFAFAHAAPLVKRIVVDPPITSPTASTVWTVGDKVNVTWDASIVPSGNFTGKLVLGAQTSDSENLQLACRISAIVCVFVEWVAGWHRDCLGHLLFACEADSILSADNPLADDFDLHSGTVEITVPNVASGTNYIVVLFGDSGNASPQFTISGGSSSSAAPSSTVSEATSTAPSSSVTPTARASTPAAAPSETSDAPPAPPTSAAPTSTPPTSVGSSSASSPTSSSRAVSPAQDQGAASGALSTHANALTMSAVAGLSMVLMFAL